MAAKIHPLAHVEPGAKLGEGVVIEPFAVVKATVTLEKNVVIRSNSYIAGNTHIGEGTVIYPSVSIGTEPQHRKYDGRNTKVTIGKHCVIREFVTINSSADEGSTVSVGDHTYIMAYCHLAHNCSVGSHVTMANQAQLAGHVTIEDYANIGGVVAFHQHVRVGRYAMVGGFSRVTLDIPPFTIGSGVPYKLAGLNLIGLKRNNFSFQTRRALSRAFRLVYRSGLHIDEALARIAAEVELLPEVQTWVDFFKSSKRGIERALEDTLAAEEEEEVAASSCR
jgi:UDP-N-acetylglucosamine acyltransferase